MAAERKKRVWVVLALLALIGICVSVTVYECEWVHFGENGTKLVRFRGFFRKTYVVPDGVRVIGRKAFALCYRLTAVTIPAGVMRIENEAFLGCESLTAVALPETLEEIGDLAFGGCRSLTEITIPDSVTSIGEFAFVGCENLETVSLPRDVKLGEKVFEGCPKVKIAYR